MARSGDLVTLVLNRKDVGIIVSALGTESERWAKRARGLAPNGLPWSDAVKNASRALETKQHLLRYLDKARYRQTPEAS